MQEACSCCGGDRETEFCTVCSEDVDNCSCEECTSDMRTCSHCDGSGEEPESEN